MTSPDTVTAYSYATSQPTQKSNFTLSDLINQVTRQFGDESNVQITNTDIIRWANMGLVEIARTNRVWEKTAHLLSQVITPIGPPGRGGQPPLSGDDGQIIPDPPVDDETQFLIPLPDDCSMLQAVRYGGKILPGLDFEQLMIQANGTLSLQGTPTCYYMWSGFLGFYPQPDTADVRILIYYRGTPPFMSTLADPIPLPDKYFDALTVFVMKKAYELDEDWQAQKVQQINFDQNITALSEEVDAYAGDFYTITDAPYEQQQIGGVW